MKNKPYETKPLVRFRVSVHAEERREETKMLFYHIDQTLTIKPAVWSVLWRGPGQLPRHAHLLRRHVEFIKLGQIAGTLSRLPPAVILHFGSTTHIPA